MPEAHSNPAAERLRQLLTRGELILMPYRYDARSAKLIEQAGFELTFMSGFAASAKPGSRRQSRVHSMNQLPLPRRMSRTPMTPPARANQARFLRYLNFIAMPWRRMTSSRICSSAFIATRVLACSASKPILAVSSKRSRYAWTKG